MDEKTKALVDRFLAWKLPASVRSDLCVTMDYPHPRYGTNLLTAAEAREMIEHLFGPTIRAQAEEIERLKKLLYQHHHHHLDQGNIGLPDGAGGWIEIENADAYSESSMCEQTVAALEGVPIEPMLEPRGAIKANWWEFGVKQRRLRKAAEAKITALTEQHATMGAVLDEYRAKLAALLGCGNRAAEIKQEVFALCEDTEEKCAAIAADATCSEIERAYARGRIHEAKGIRRTIGALFEAEQNSAVRWQGIETAPTDGTKVLLAKIVGHPDHPTALWWVCRGYWSARWNNWNDGIEPCGLAGPTHWAHADAHGIRSAALAVGCAPLRAKLAEATRLLRVVEDLDKCDPKHMDFWDIYNSFASEARAFISALEPAREANDGK